MKEGIAAPGVQTGGGPEPAARPPGGEAWAEFLRAPVRMRVFLLGCAAAALALPLLLADLGPTPSIAAWLTAGVLVGVSVLNVEISRALAGGVEHSHQPHKALSAWSFASALLLAPPWLLVVVPVSYVHARWRGVRLPLWKWVGSAVYLVLAGVAAAVVRHLLRPDEPNWMAGDGGGGILPLFVAAAAFLVVESVLFAGSALLNHREDEVWLRRTLSSLSFYRTESAVLLIGGLLAALWTGGAWFVLLLVPIYAIAQRAALHEPLRERAEASARLAEKNRELEAAHDFKVDLLGMLGHEIGNPMTAIIGYAQVGADALRADDRDLARRSFTVVEANAARIRTVLDEILSMVSSEGGALVAHPEECRLEPHLRKAAAAQPPDRQPAVVCPEDLTAQVQPGHLDQMLANLLANAEKYAGGATCLRAAATDHGEVEIEVIDAGPGVAPEFEDRLFDKFSRGTQTAGRLSGTGLGLFITRELARANRGDVSHRRARPSGSVFVVRLPGHAEGPIDEIG